MNTQNKFFNALIGMTLGILSCTMALPIAAQEIPIRVIPSNAPLVPYSPFAFTADGLRQSFTELPAAPPSVSINGSRVVVTVLISSDRRPPQRFDSTTFEAVLAPGVYTVEVVERGAMVAERRSAPITITVPTPTQASVSAFSVFDRKIKKFFLTASASDVAGLVASNNSTTGPEWIPVEDNIRVWTTAQPFTVPVCRFYVPAAAVHFFSADEYNDCRKLRGLAGFTDEGTAFHVIPPYREPDAVGLGGSPGKFLSVCPKGTDPVYRMFDDTPEHAAHRYSASPDVVDSFVSSYILGNQSAYRLEGVVFCSLRE